ncbi:aminopeptidase N-like [Culicoides brevitarsis]|uniref:aminopeptidase N-like n=1 Tax=Culicoides brevitarsis TaxID=469753 RepID=UPI00307B5FC0
MNDRSPISHVTIDKIKSETLDDQHSYRLPNNTKPINYEVHLTTNIDKGDFEFDGRVVITLEALEETDNITIHYRQVTIQDVQVKDSSGKEVKISGLPMYDDVTEHYVVFVDKLSKGSQYKMTIDYNATLRDDLAGFHKSSYKNEEGETVWQAGTHFEPHNARHGFPCYDEPALRATFDISITHASTYHAVSNMPVKEIKKETDDMVTTVFEQTIPIQTYLIAFVVSDFSYVSFNKSDGIPYQLFAKPSAIRHGEGDFGLIAGERILMNQEQYFATKYALPKMSQIAMPDFGAGAMENYGIVIYAQSLLLYDETEADVDQKHAVGHIIAHEFAHQWFGNHVAPKWWSYLWLNEGFATLYAAHTMSLVYPEFRDIDLFVLSNLQQSAMRADATGVSRPMTFYVENHQGIRNLFDDISYSKAACVLRMFQHTLTEETWRKGLKYYLEDMKFKAADSDDFARNLQKAADEDKFELVTMKAMVDSWTKQGGFPIVFVNRTGNTVTLTQQKYIQQTRANDIFLIPISFATKSHPNFTDTSPVAFMLVEKLSFKNDTYHKFAENDWMVFNVQETGYYRVNYDENLWHLIAEKLDSETFEDIHVINRAQIIDDVLNLAKNDMVKYEIVFHVLQYLEREVDFLPWSSANNGLSYLNRMMTGSDHYGNFQKYMAKLVGPLYETLGSHDLGTKDDLSDKKARSIALNWACLSGEEKCIKDTKARVDKVLEDPEVEIEANIRSAIYCNGLRQATQETFDNAQKRLKATTDTNSRRTLINGMGCIVDAKLHQQNLQLTLDAETYTKAEKTRVLQAIYTSGGRDGVEAVIDFFSVDFKEIDDLYGENTVRNNIFWIAPYVTSKNVFGKFEKLVDQMIEEKILAASEKETILEDPNANMKWLEENNEEIGVFFKGYFGNGATGLMISSSILVFLGVVLQIFMH